MAKVELRGPLASVSGMISRDSEVYFRTYRGRTFLCKRPMRGVKGKGKKPHVTPAQKTQQELFRQAMEMTKAIMESAGLRSVYESRWKRQKKYVTLRGFVSAKMMELAKGGAV